MEEPVSKRRRDRFSELPLPDTDRFSELPISLIHLILSFLPMRDVVLTTLLSKRWKNLWTTVPCLNFCNLTKSEDYDEAETGKARSFVNRALIFWRGFGILKFKLDFIWSIDSPLAADIDVWVRFAVENKVEELNIHLMCTGMEQHMDSEDIGKFLYQAPLCLNSCSSIRELSLVGCNLRIPVPPSWNQLKTLKIDGYCFSEILIHQILLGSPQLEVFELRLVESNEDLSIRSTSLKKLKIEKFLIDGFVEPSKDKVLRICCPNLEMLAISGVLYSKYVFTEVSSVTDVTLGLNCSYDYAYANEFVEETLEHMFTTFQHVRKVTLSYWCVQVLGVLQEKYVNSSLPNVKFFPNLEMLVIKDQTWCTHKEFESCTHTDYKTEIFDAIKYVNFERKLSKSFMLQLKTVDITSYLRSTSTYMFILFLFKNASMLEKLVVRMRKTDSTDYWFKVAQRLLCMTKWPPNANVILKPS